MDDQIILILGSVVEYLYQLNLTFVENENFKQGPGKNNKGSNLNVKTLGFPPVFVLCESCHWCATYLDKARLPSYDECPYCSSDMLSSFPILPTEAFTFDYSEKRGVELEFRRRVSSS